MEIFFVLSGFLVAYNYKDAVLNYDLQSSFEYMLSKLQKFYLLHILTFIVCLFHMERHGFTYPDGVYGFIRDVFLNVTLLKSWYDPAKFTFNGVTWFLSCILFIYFCVPYIIHFFKSKKYGEGTALCSFFILFILKITFDTFGYKMGMNPWPGVFGWYCNPAYRLIDFLLGYTGFLIFSTITISISTIKISIFQCSMLMFYLAVCRVFDKQWVPAPFILLTVLLIFSFTIHGGIFEKLFGNKILVHLGNISFELYIVHQVNINLMSRGLNKILDNNHLAVFLMLLGISWLMAEFFYWRPVKRLITSKLW